MHHPSLVADRPPEATCPPADLPGEASWTRCRGQKRRQTLAGRVGSLLLPAVWSLRCRQGPSCWTGTCSCPSPREFSAHGADGTQHVCQVLGQGLPSPDRSSTWQLDEGWEKACCCSLQGRMLLYFCLLPICSRASKQGGQPPFFFHANFPFFFACLSEPSTKPRAVYILRE